MRKGLIGVFSSALLCMLAADATATSVQRLTNEALAAVADTIVIGSPVQQRSAWEDGTLVTFVTIDVTETLKGDGAERLTVVLPGGIDTGRKFPVAVTIAGAPTIAPHEQVLLFLVNGQDVANAHSVAGFSQGKFSIVAGADGEQYVARDMTDVAVQSGTGVARGTQTRERLSTFREEIQRHLSAQGEGR